MVELEKHPSDKEILASIFRTIHTIKGTSGFLGFGKLEAVTHVGESLLARLRDGQFSMNPERTTALLAMIDAVRQMLAQTKRTAIGERTSRISGDLTLLQQPSAGDSAEPAPRCSAITEVSGAGEVLIARAGSQARFRKRWFRRRQAAAIPRAGETVDQGAVKPQKVREVWRVRKRLHGQGATESTIRVDVGCSIS